MTKLMMALAIALVGCAPSPQAPAPARTDESMPSNSARSDIRNAFDHVDQSGPTGRDF